MCVSEPEQSEENILSLPQAVSPAEWQAASERLLAKEQEATGARDALGAERRKLPMVQTEKDHLFEYEDSARSDAAIAEELGTRWSILHA
jgi:predicted dithiol-disulfide oxidoreductase (DUF899 family)